MSSSNNSYLAAAAAAAAAAAVDYPSSSMSMEMQSSSASRGKKRGNGDEEEGDDIGLDNDHNHNTSIGYQVTGLGDSGVSPYSSSVKKRRADSSLGVLAKKFIQKLMAEENGKVELTNLSEELGVPKRRVYDIVNILEGIDVARKEAMSNTITWTGPRVKCIRTEADVSGGRDDLNEIERVWNLRMEVFDNEREISKLKAESKELDQCINQAQLGVRTLLSDTKGYAYVTKENIIKLPLFKNQTVMAIKAPAGTKLEVPDPEEGLKNSQNPQRKYQMFLTSPGGAMDIFLVDSNNDGNDDIKRKLKTVASRSDGSKKNDGNDDMNTWKNSQDLISSQDELDPSSLTSGDDHATKADNNT